MSQALRDLEAIKARDKAINRVQLGFRVQSGRA
jgi:hypothetical protein